METKVHIPHATAQKRQEHAHELYEVVQQAWTWQRGDWPLHRALRV